MIIERQELLNITAELHKRIAELEAENKALHERVEMAKTTLDGRLGDVPDAVRFACEEYVKAEDALQEGFDSEDYRLSNAVKSVVARLEKAEAELAQHTKNEVFLRQQADNWEAKYDKAEAAAAEMRKMIPDLWYYSSDDCPLSQAQIDRALSSKLGQPLLDRMRAMKEILNSANHDEIPGLITCSELCIACRWKAFKEAKT